MRMRGAVGFTGKTGRFYDAGTDEVEHPDYVEASKAGWVEVGPAPWVEVGPAPILRLEGETDVPGPSPQ